MPKNLLTITTDDLIAYKAQVAEQLMIMRFTVGKSTFLVVPMTQKWFLALGTNEMLNVPIFTQCGDHTLFDRTTACSAYGNAHFIMAT